MQRAAFLSLILAAYATLAGEPNLLPNPSFEDASGERPAGWQRATWGGRGTFEHAGEGRTGKRSLLLASENGGDISWTATVAIEPFARYRLSGWIKTEGVVAVEGGKGALLNLHNFSPQATRALTGTNGWTRVDLDFDAEGNDAAQVNCLLGGWGRASGKAWYDDLELEKIGAGQAPAPSIAIDAAREGAPISKYIYGQFIEHLGRCIYGGIWAEMLEDRKFYLAVGARGSPWTAVGKAEAVAMVGEGAFVGAHTPEITLDGEPRGLVQGRLGLLAGKGYAGRIWISGTEDAGPIRVSLVWGDGPSDRQAIAIEKVNGTYARIPLHFTAGKSTDDGRLEVIAAGKGRFRVGTASLMPEDNVQGMRTDTLELLRQLDSPIYRWPGGNFVSGYDWKDGLGDSDRRPPRKNPAWTGIEHNDFGIDEFMAFCRILGTDPYIAVNTGQGEAKSAVEEVQYANGAPETPLGMLRAQNGHLQPYRVKYWGVGNEMYGDWQIGHMPLEKYIEKHNQFAEALRAADPGIQLVAVGEAGRWSEGMMQHCASHMDLVSEHFYTQERPGLAGHVAQVPAAIRQKAEAHRRYRRDFDSLKGKDIRIALDEWNYWYGPHLYGELGTRYFLKDALGIAAGLNEYARQSDMIFMANYAQTVNVIGCIKTTRTAAAFDTTGLVLKLYRQRFGVLPLATESSPRGLDAQAAFSQDRKTLTLSVINASLRELEAPLSVKGAKLTGAGLRFQIGGGDPKAYNEPGKPPAVTIEESRVKGLAGMLSLPPCSITLLVLDVES